MISDNIKSITEKIRTSACRGGRKADDVTLVAVTKKVDHRYISEALASGVTIIGENRVQEAAAKHAFIHEDAVWHLIGNLQTNKVKKAVQLFDMIQAVDSLRLADSIDKHARASGKIQDCLVEVKISSEETKHGIAAGQIEEFLSHAPQWPHIRIKGLMTIAPYSDDPENSRPYFKRMKELFDTLKGKSLADNIDLSVLSMGMSGDFEVAIEEGSTMVRIGTAIFGER